MLNAYDWKVDPDRRQNRSSGICVKRKMTSEEIAKYGLAKKEDIDMPTKLDVDEAKLLEICREHGTSTVAADKIGEAFGINRKQSYGLIHGRGIKKKLLDEKETEAEQMKKQKQHNDLVQQVAEMLELVPDNVNHPVHYTTGKIEVINYLQDKMTHEMFEGFCVGNALKYLSRYRLKGGVEDLKKAKRYIEIIVEAKADLRSLTDNSSNAKE